MSTQIETTCVQGGYHPGNAEPRQIPIYQSTTWKYDSSEFMGKLFDLEESGYFYTRLHSFRGRIAELFIRRRSRRGGMIDYVRFQDGIQSTSESTIGR